MKLLLTSLCAAPALALLAPLTVEAADGCSSTTTASATYAGEKDIVDTALAAGDFNTLTTALTAAGLVDALRGEGPFTVFAPTDAAFANLPKGTVESLLKPKQLGTLQSILTYHVVSGNVAAKDVVKLSFAETLNGQRVDIKVDEGNVMIDGAKVVTTDIKCANGVIHVIDAVIMPSTQDIIATAKGAGSFGTLLAAVEAAGLTKTLMGDGPFTVFAPSDAAFAKLPEGTVESLLKPENLDQLASILKYHVVSGRVYSDQALKAGKAKTLLGKELKIEKNDHGAFVGGAALSALDIETSNGVIHVIDSVLLPE